MKLDRGRYYAIVYGDPVAKYYQDKTFFRGDGTPVDSDKTPEEPVKEKAKVAIVEQSDAKDKSDAKAKEKADAAKLKKLQGLHISKLKKMAVALAESLEHEKPVLKGKGLKKNLIAYIVENTE